MQDSIKNIHKLVEQIQTVEDVAINELDVDEIKRFLELNGDYSSVRSFDYFLRKTKENYGIELTKEQRLVHFLQIILFWTRGEQVSNEGILFGGTFFNGFTDIMHFEPTFYEKSLKEFLKYEEEEKTNIKLIKQLRFIESPTPPISGYYTPQFGCVTLRKNEFPDHFYYYDSGLVYDLPFQSYEEYIEGLVCSAAVIGWQYFYIDPQDIIDKNHCIDYITWSMHINNTLDESLKGFTHVPNAAFDRLDMIADYLERCVRLLPSTFPFMDFTHHKQYYKKFKSLYNMLKAESGEITE